MLASGPTMTITDQTAGRIYWMQRSSRADIFAIRAIFVSVGATLALASCAQMAEVKPKRAVLQGPPGAEPLASAEQEIAHALRIERAEPLHALGNCVEALDIASRELRRIRRTPRRVAIIISRSAA